ncbi:hypothetical protein KKC44_05100 [Patescibacteria group bacterium]|nr:hypothetical protein [Patescibacteria group bacterium]MBU2259952.1 hypothetical protein [Patescibacteria group bacterium]
MKTTEGLGLPETGKRSVDHEASKQDCIWAQCMTNKEALREDMQHPVGAVIQEEES